MTMCFAGGFAAFGLAIHGTETGRKFGLEAVKAEHNLATLDRKYIIRELIIESASLLKRDKDRDPTLSEHEKKLIHYLKQDHKIDELQDKLASMDPEDVKFKEIKSHHDKELLRFITVGKWMWSQQDFEREAQKARTEGVDSADVYNNQKTQFHGSLTKALARSHFGQTATGENMSEEDFKVLYNKMKEDQKTMGKAEFNVKYGHVLSLMQKYMAARV